MSDVYAISRIANYKYSDVGGVLKEALRILPNYDNPDCDPNKSYLNYALVECDLKGLTPEKYILKYREDNNIKGRFNTSATNPKNLTNCMSQCLFTASSEWFEALNENERFKYFEDCLDFFKSEFPSVEIISAIVHRDEPTEHLHVSFLPTVERVNNKTGAIETIFSTTKLMPGKDFFPQYQDRFYKFISEKYDGFSRNKSNYKSLPIKEYKQFRDLKNKCDELYSELNEHKKVIYNQKLEISRLYDEIRDLNEHKLLLERLPLIGKLFTFLRQLSDDCCRSVLLQSIDLAKRELEKEIESKNEISLSAKIAAAEKRGFLDSIFGSKNNQYRKNKDTEIDF